MTTELAVNLLDTFPGRMLIGWWGEWRALHPEFSSAQYTGRSGNLVRKAAPGPLIVDGVDGTVQAVRHLHELGYIASASSSAYSWTTRSAPAPAAGVQDLSTPV